MADGRLFYTMPNVEGVTLEHRLEHQGRMEMDEAPEIVTDVAGALRSRSPMNTA